MLDAYIINRIRQEETARHKDKRVPLYIEPLPPPTADDRQSDDGAPNAPSQSDDSENGSANIDFQL